MSPYAHRAILRSYVSSKVVMLLNKGPDDLGSYSGGTGFHLTLPSGKIAIITNRHVCELARNGYLWAHLDNSEEQVEVKEMSDDTDLCLVSPMKKVKGLSLARNLYEGEIIAAVGHPNLQPMTMTLGEVVGYQQVVFPLFTIMHEMDMYLCENANNRYLQPIETKIVNGQIVEEWACMAFYNTLITTINVQQGSSGSPVVDFFGNVVGVIFLMERSSTWGKAVPLKDLKAFVEKK